MNQNSSNWTGRTHRSMNSAFGPYARGPIDEQYDPMPREDKIVTVFGAAVLAGVVVALVMGWL
jgi:hypothetical protein